MLSLCAKWLSALSEIHNQPASKEKVRLYTELLADVPVDALSVAFRKAAQQCQRYPSIAEIRGLVRSETNAIERFDGENAWDLVKVIFRKHWHPDIGFHGDPPRLDAAGEYALRQIGGMKRFAQSDIAGENWVRKEFLEAYQRFHETGHRLAPTREEAVNLLDKLKRGELPE